MALSRVAAMVAVGAMWLGGAASASIPLSSCPAGEMAGTEYELGEYWVAVPETQYEIFLNFRVYEVEEVATGTMLRILEHCPDGRQVVLRLSGEPTQPGAAREQVLRFGEMIYGERQYSLSQMVRILRDMGANAEERRVNYQTCACATENWL